MHIVLKTIKNKDRLNIEPLFVSNNTNYNQTSLTTILENMRILLTEEQKEIVNFISLYAGDYEFEDCPETRQRQELKDIYFILKVKDNKPQEILTVSDSYYKLEEIKNLLNKEIENKNISYKLMNVRGKLK